MGSGRKPYKTNIPPKSDLETLYHIQFKTQSEIGGIYQRSQKVVFGWFKDLGIKSRIPYKRDQRGNKNSSWKDSVSYAAYHYRVRAERGSANKCEVCNKEAKKYEWANLTDNYNDVNDYKMMCISCHKKYDRIGENFRKKRVNKRKVIDGK